jgi:Tfp pilus assembly protein PilX
MEKIMFKTLKKTVSNEDGFALGASILISTIVILTAVLALWKSNTEVQVVRNERELTIEFYNAESGVIDALENYNTGPIQWLTTDFLTTDPKFAYAANTSNDENGNSMADIEVRCIEKSGTAVAELSTAANTLPLQPHKAPPPSGSGYSLKYFEVRRYGITATSSDGNTQVQVGAYKVFNKF